MGGTGSGRRILLTPCKVRAIYAAMHGPNTLRGVARYFGSSTRTVHRIHAGLIYADVTNVSERELSEALFNYILARKKYERAQRTKGQAA